MALSKMSCQSRLGLEARVGWGPVLLQLRPRDRAGSRGRGLDRRRSRALRRPLPHPGSLARPLGDAQGQPAGSVSPRPARARRTALTCDAAAAAAAAVPGAPPPTAPSALCRPGLVADRPVRRPDAGPAYPADAPEACPTGLRLRSASPHVRFGCCGVPEVPGVIWTQWARRLGERRGPCAWARAWAGCPRSGSLPWVSEGR